MNAVVDVWLPSFLSYKVYCLLGNIKQNIIRLGINVRLALNLTNDQKRMEAIYLHPSLRNGWQLKLLMAAVVTMMVLENENKEINIDDAQP